MSLTPEQMKEAVGALSPEQRKAMLSEIFAGLSSFAAEIVEHQDEIWEAGELPEPEFLKQKGSTQ